jgi:uncharacterized protein YecE (DUF72 family)
MPGMTEIRVGTSAFTAAGWEGAFYPAGMKPADYLTFYATKFNTVEVDSTFYRTPSVSTVKGWYAKTPKDFIFALKVPQTITHEKMLLNCGDDLKYFMATADHLGDKLGPMLFQFPYFNKMAFKTGDEFLARLEPFLKTLPKEHSFAIEIRNKAWLTEEFADLLRVHCVALALQDQSWMPLPTQMNFDYVTAPFAYMRLLGDRKGIEKQTKIWDKVIVNRSRELRNWVEVCEKTVKRGAKTFVYINNHFSGHAPATVQQFIKLWNS